MNYTKTSAATLILIDMIRDKKLLYSIVGRDKMFAVVKLPTDLALCGGMTDAPQDSHRITISFKLIYS